jgi:hypothetical protein
MVFNSALKGLKLFLKCEEVAFITLRNNTHHKAPVHTVMTPGIPYNGGNFFTG